MFEIRQLQPTDRDAIEAELRRSPPYTMFLRSNLRDGAIVADEPSAPYDGVWFGVFDEELCGVGAQFGNGALLMHARRGATELAGELARRFGARASVLPGELAQIEILRSTPEISARETIFDSAELLYTLDLDSLVAPPLLDEATVRPPRDDEFDLLVEWRRAYIAEALGGDPGDVAEKMRAKIASDAFRVLEVDGEPVAMTGFNARVPEMVQVGGVWTPPELRGRGYARTAVAGHLREAADGGVESAVLFTAEENVAAQRAYSALGFEHVGRYALVSLAPAG